MPHKTSFASTYAENPASPFNRAGVTFVFTELEVAISCCQQSLISRDPSRAIRSLANARRALQVALERRKKYVFSEGEKKDLAEKVCELKLLFREVTRRKIPQAMAAV
jgi:hypothetical protein